MKNLTIIFLLSLIATLFGLIFYITKSQQDNIDSNNDNKETSSTINTIDNPVTTMTKANYKELGLEIEYPSDWVIENKGKYSFIISKSLADPTSILSNFLLINILPKNLDLADSAFERFNRINFNKLLQIKPDNSWILSNEKGLAKNFMYKREKDINFSSYIAKLYINEKPLGFPEGTTEKIYIIENEYSYIILTEYTGIDKKDPFYIDKDSIQRIINTLIITPTKIESGQISGKLCYPSQFLPTGTIIAKDKEDNTMYEIIYPGSNSGGGNSYTVTVKPGVYILSYEIMLENNKIAGFHTDVCPTGIETSCKAENPRKHIEALVIKDSITNNIDLCDFYYNDETKPVF